MPPKRDRLAARRKAVGFNQDELAERLKVDRSTIVRWESGDTTPQPWTRPRLARTLGISVDQLDDWLREDSPATAEDTQVPEGDAARATAVTVAPAGSSDPDAADGTNPYTSVVRYLQNEAGYDSDEESMRRRSFLITTAALAGLGTASTQAAMEAVRRELSLALVEERAAADADEWQEIVRDYGETYSVAAPAELIRPLMTDMIGIQAALHRHAPGGSASQRDLLSAAALLAAFTAQTVENLCQPLEARRWWRTAKNAADRSGDPFSALWVRSREILRALESRPLPEILRLIAEAESMTSQAPPAATLALTQVKAAAFAQAGRIDDATEALGLLRTQFSQSPAGFSGSVLTWEQDTLHGTESFCYARLGDFQKAETATTNGLNLYAANGYTGKRWQADLQLYLAFALVRTGDTREGLRHAQTVISNLPQAHRAKAAEDGRTLLDIVPASEQQRAEVTAYREWVSSLTVPAMA